LSLYCVRRPGASSVATRRRKSIRRSGISSNARSARPAFEDRGKHIALEAVLIRNVELPDAIRHAIDQKLAAEQDVLKMKYVIEVAKYTAEQRRIEAQGISEYNQTVAASLTSPMLEFDRIQELNRLAASSNAKTVVIGPGAGGTPVLLSTPTATSR